MQLSSPKSLSSPQKQEPDTEQKNVFSGKITSWMKYELKSNQENILKIKLAEQRFNRWFIDKLDNLNLSDFQLNSIPREIGLLTQLKELDLSHNQLKDVPKEIFEIENLEILNLSYNNLSQLPVAEINKLTNLRVLNVLGNKFTQDFDFKLSNASIILENPQSLNDFFLLLTVDAQFSEVEKNSDYKILLDDSIFKDMSEPPSLEISKDLLSRLQEMNEYFSLDKLPEIHSDSQKIISTLIKSLNNFLYKSTSQKKSNQDQKKIIARQLLTICSQIYEKKDDPLFFEQLSKFFFTKQIPKEKKFIELDKKHEDDIALMIFNLKNLCNKLNFQEFSKQKVIPFFKYLKRQLIFCYINKLAAECTDSYIKIHLGNYSDNIECKISLNFLRIINKNFGKKLDLNLPHIIDQGSGKLTEYQPSPEIISKFEEIISNNKKLFAVLATQLSEEIYDHKAINISEISNFEFIKKIKEKVDEVYESKIEDLRKLITPEAHLKKIIIANLQSFPKLEFARLICDQFLELAKNKQPNSVIETENIKRNFDQAYRNSLGEPTTMLSARNSNRASYDRIQPSSQQESMEPQSSPKIRSSIAKCFSKCLSVFFRS